jgi:predicted DNA-binding transcriptional regulator YafY
LYVVGLDHKSGEVRTFAIDRIRRIETTDHRFGAPADFDFDRYIGSSFGVIAEPATPVCIRFAPDWATHIEERTWHPSQHLESEPDGSLLLRMEVGGLQELRSWVLSFGSKAEVLEPTSLRNEVIRELETAVANYDAVDRRR